MISYDQIKRLFVALKGNQVIDGIKRFEQFGFTPHAAPEENYHFANKKYVDDATLFTKLEILASGNTEANENDNWQIIEDSGNLLFQKRIGGAWVTKWTITP